MGENARARDPILVLPRLVDAPPAKPRRAGAGDTQAFALRVATDSSCWSPAEARAMAERFDALAPSWDEERSSYRPAPLADALERGGPFADGSCLEIGAGTGVLTPLLRARFPTTISLDLSPGMLERARGGPRVRADASLLPVRTASLAAVAIGDAPLFADEVVRVLAPNGAVLWSNALGRDAPYFVPTPVLLAALEQAAGQQFRAVTSEALWGSWAVLSRLAGPPREPRRPGSPEGC